MSRPEEPIRSPASDGPWLPADFGAVRRFAAGEFLFHAGEAPSGMYIIDAGRVEVFVPVEGGESKVLAELGPNDTVGEMAVLDDVTRSASARAAVETETRFLEREELLRLLERRPAIALGFIREFIHRMRAINRRYFDEIVQAERLATVGRFTRTIVHDFKNPLATIRWTSELASAEGTPAAARQTSHERILRQVERMQTMLHELIEFTRPGGQKPDLRAADFAAFVRSFAAEAGADLTARGFDLNCRRFPTARSFEWTRSASDVCSTTCATMRSTRCRAAEASCFARPSCRRGSGWNWKTPVRASPPRWLIGCSRPSPPMARRAAPASDSRSAAVSRRTTEEPSPSLPRNPAAGHAS